MTGLLLRSQLKGISRREFLKLAGSSLLGALILPGSHNPLQPLDPETDGTLARVLEDTVTLYRQPSFSSSGIKTLHKDDLLPLTWATIGDDEPTHNRVWYELDGLGFAHSSVIQPVKNTLNPISRDFPANGRVAEVTVPFTDAAWHYRTPENIAFRLYYGSNHWITGSVLDDNGQVWYTINDDTLGYPYYARAEYLHVITAEELSPISPEVPPAEKRVEVHIDKQIMVCYEGETPVLIAPCATGAKFGEKDLYTPKGEFSTNIKAHTRHMAHRDASDPNSYDLPGVPWVIYLTVTGIAFHGTYWHNDYGKKRSHGCINLPISTARWLYRWSTPFAPPTERLYMTAIGTTVLVL